MKIIKELQLQESKNIEFKELNFTKFVINKIYKEWKKIKRRRNAVDIISTSVNAITKLSPHTIAKLSDEYKSELSIIIMRCLDLPTWRPIKDKQKIFDKLLPFIKGLETQSTNTGTNSTLRDTIATRFSSNIFSNTDNAKVFVVYEKKIPKSYITFLFDDENKPTKIYRMLLLSIPESFDSLIGVLINNHNKANANH